MSTWQHAPVDLPQDNLQRPTDGQMVAQQLHGALYNPFKLPMPPPAAGRGPWPVDWPEGRNNCITNVKLLQKPLSNNAPIGCKRASSLTLLPM